MEGVDGLPRYQSVRFPVSVSDGELAGAGVVNNGRAFWRGPRRTDQGGEKATVMMIPGEQLTAVAEFALPGISARLLPTSMGAIALFGHQSQDLGELSRDVLDNVTPLAQVALSLL